jgi:hypothetical protein
MRLLLLLLLVMMIRVSVRLRLRKRILLLNDLFKIRTKLSDALTCSISYSRMIIFEKWDDHIDDFSQTPLLIRIPLLRRSSIGFNELISTPFGNSPDSNSGGHSGRFWVGSNVGSELGSVKTDIRTEVVGFVKILRTVEPTPEAVRRFWSQNQNRPEPTCCPLSPKL